jgi:hypothetical protein
VVLTVSGAVTELSNEYLASLPAEHVIGVVAPATIDVE